MISSRSILIRINLIIAFINCLSAIGDAQQTIFGTKNYVEYQIGTLPIIISVPHGGSIEPSSIPNRTCNNPVYTADVYTIETALEIKNQLFLATGCYPHLIVSQLKRSKLDPNRNLADGACGNTEAETAWNEFHQYIEVAQDNANQQYNKQSFFIDLHGHGNPIQRIELGYLLYDYELLLSDSILNTEKYINYSSIKNLAEKNPNNFTHAELLRGSESFGTLLSNHYYSAVPSQNLPSPDISSNYFSGGYTIANHTCYKAGIEINGLQMELNYNGIRDSSNNRKKFAKAFCDVLITYMNTHFVINLTDCAPSYCIHESAPDNKLVIFPNPVQKGELILLKNLENKLYHYKLYNTFGQEIKYGLLENGIDTSILNSGAYIIIFTEIKSGKKYISKLLIK